MWTAPAWVIISLGRVSPRGSCSLPGARGRRAASRPKALLLLGFAPGGGYLAARIAASAGGLLLGKSKTFPFGETWFPHHLFTLTWTIKVHRRYVSVARSGRLPRPGNYPAPCPVECGLSSALP